MSLNVGINNNLVFSKALKNDRGTLVIGFKDGIKVDPITAFNSGEQTSFKPNEQDVFFYPPKIENYDGKVDTLENIMNKIAEIVDPLNHILQTYMKTEDVRKGWDMFKGTGVTADNMQAKLTNQTTLTKVYGNIVDQFLVMAQPLLDDDLLVRVMFSRTSANKHYPTLRRRYLDTYPFIESMSVPENSTRLRFSPWEIKKGLDNGTPLASNSSISKNEVEVAEDLFKG